MFWIEKNGRKLKECRIGVRSKRLWMGTFNAIPDGQEYKAGRSGNGFLKMRRPSEKEKIFFNSCIVGHVGENATVMSHTATVFSPAGTPLLDRTVGEIVAERPSQARVFQAFGIDFCCQGGRTLREACNLKGIAADSVIEQLEVATREQEDKGENPALLPPSDLADHIVATHHQYLRSELPRLQAMAERVARVHGGHTPSLVEVHEVFCAMSDELAGHMMKEEQVLFPAVKALSQGGPAVMPLEGPVACMLQEHDDAGGALARMRELTNGFTPPPEACNTYRALFAGLLELEEDLHRHIHLENAVLFPQALAMSRA
jgi:regulator of cell morphogenesis and NO signaling